MINLNNAKRTFVLCIVLVVFALVIVFIATNKNNKSQINKTNVNHLSTEDIGEYIMDHTQSTQGGNVEPITKIELGNGYNYFLFDEEKLDTGYDLPSQIIYGNFYMIGDNEIDVILNVDSFFYNENYVFAYNGSYKILDTMEKRIILSTIDMNEFDLKVKELYGSNYKWINVIELRTQGDGSYGTQGDGSVVSSD